MRKEWLARIFVFVLLVAAVGIPAAGWWQRSQGILIRARMAETGGWTPENLTAEVGQPLHLRLTSEDVTHGFAIGQSDQPAVDIYPGEVTEVTVRFDKPGKYTFYCTRWCSVNHWRMRGVIEVTGQDAQTDVSTPPLYVTLGIDIDGEHRADILPAQKPSALRGALLGQNLPAEFKDHEYYQTHTPLELWKELRSDALFQNHSDQDIWDWVAWVWQLNATAQDRKEGQQIFNANCAACHGEQGNGNGVFAEALAQPVSGDQTEMPAGEMTVRPVDFTAAEHMLAASPAHLQGKIIRGGMGTGMPYWGPIFTDQQTWALVAYLWTFQFEMEVP